MDTLNFTPPGPQDLRGGFWRHLNLSPERVAAAQNYLAPTSPGMPGFIGPKQSFKYIRPGLAAKLGTAWRSYSASKFHRGGMDWLKMTYGVGPKYGVGWPKWMGRGFLGFSAIQGFQEGGLVGAIKNVAADSMISYALGGVAHTVLSPVLAGLGVAAAMGGIAYASTGGTPTAAFRYLTRPYVNEYMKKHARLELATPALDEFGTIATMRQRSLQSIQNSRLNGRTALGNEAALIYNPYFR